jgi:hypothetical protein
MAATHALVLMTQVVFVALLATSIQADEIDDKIKEINDELVDAQIAAHEKALASVRDLQSHLVKRDDERQEYVRNWKIELDTRLTTLREPPAMNADALKKLEKEFEAVGKGEWWWLDKANPDQREKWYRLNTGRKRWENMSEGSNGKPQVDPVYSATYEILGLDKADEDIILVKMVYPPKGARPGDQAIMRFSRRTGVIETTYGWYGEPKAKKGR